MKNNKGLSLIELIVVVAILGVFAGTVGFSIRMINSARTSSCAKDINSALDYVKTRTMSKEDPTYLIIYRSTKEGKSGYYYAYSTKPDTFSPNEDVDRRAGTINIKLYYNLVGDTQEKELIDQYVVIGFDKASGAFKNFTPAAVGTKLVSGQVQKIKVAGSSSPSYVTLVVDTGKHYIE